MSKWLKTTIGIFVSLIILFIIGGTIFYFILKRSLPVYEGELEVNGNSGDIEVYRDSFAIPYIFANSDEDAAFALGFLHAQERLFQMDIIRRAGQGRLSEIFGKRTLNYDIMFRTVDIENSAKQSFQLLDYQTKELLKSYSAGVNAFIQSNKSRLPVEFDFLQYEPYPWKPEHSLIVARMMAWELNLSWWSDFAFSNIVQKLGEKKAREILPEYPDNGPTIIPSGLKNAPPIDLSFIETDQSFRKFMGIEGTHIGSNNWVVNSNKSASGKCIIANDPHLSLQAPAKWYAAVIRGKSWKAEGFTLPGLPVVVIGKNQNISWTITNLMADDMDFYIEHIDNKTNRYLLNDNWTDLKTRKVYIKVKDSVDIEIKIRSTHRGPIISDVHQFAYTFPVKLKTKTDLSMRWTGSIPGKEFYAMYRINLASDWNQFREALRDFSVPGLNFVYADNKNNIGYAAAAKLPVRPENSPTFIYDGATSVSDWTGFVPYDQMPALYNPDSNYIATANNKVDKNFPYHISNIWEPSSRIERIEQMLNAKKKFSVNDFKNMQMDLISPYAKKMVSYILNAFKDKKINDKNLMSSLNLLKKWNFEISQYSQAPSIYLVYYQYLLQNIFEDDMGKNLFNQYIFLANIPYRTVDRLLAENDSSWFDNVKTPQIETRDLVIRQSMVDALNYLEKTFGKNMREWQWGRLHTVTFKHLFHGILPILDKKISVGPFETGGDGTTVCAGEYLFTNPYEETVGPSMRYIFDFAKPEEFYMILPTGQSGNPMSNNYRDMTEMWLQGEYLKVNTNESHIKNSGYKLLILK